MLCFGRRTLTVLLPVGEARRRSLREVMMRLATATDRYRPLEIAYKSLQKRNKNNYKIKITKGDYDKGEDIGGAFGWR